MTRRRSIALLVLVAAMVAGAPARSAQPATKDRMLVIDFGATLGADSDLARLVQDIFLARVHAIGLYDVLSTSDVVQMLDLEQQRQLAGCDQGSCFADIGGALGARWVTTGAVALLGGKNVLTLKLVDTQATKIDNQIAKELPEDEGQIAEAVRVASYELLRLAVPPPDDVEPWYKKWWVWGGVGAAVVGGVALTWALTKQEEVPDTGLGTVVVDAN